MLNAITISHVFVFDQDEALDFYVGKLGLEVSADKTSGFMRWLTVRVPGQPGRDILLEKPGPPAMDSGAAEQVRELISKGASGFTLGFTTKDCRKTYETLVAKGVEFTQGPVEQPVRHRRWFTRSVRQSHSNRAIARVGSVTPGPFVALPVRTRRKGPRQEVFDGPDRRDRTRFVPNLDL